MRIRDNWANVEFDDNDEPIREGQPIYHDEDCLARWEEFPKGRKHRANTRYPYCRHKVWMDPDHARKLAQ